MLQLACPALQRVLLLLSISLLTGVTIARAQQYDSTENRATQI